MKPQRFKQIKSKGKFGQPYLTFDIVPEEFIEEIIIDPRLRDTNYSYVKEELEKTGIAGDKIRQSKLYSFTAPEIILA